MAYVNAMQSRSPYAASGLGTAVGVGAGIGGAMLLSGFGALVGAAFFALNSSPSGRHSAADVAKAQAAIGAVVGGIAGGILGFIGTKSVAEGGSFTARL